MSDLHQTLKKFWIIVPVLVLTLAFLCACKASKMNQTSSPATEIPDAAPVESIDGIAEIEYPADRDNPRGGEHAKPPEPVPPPPPPPEALPETVPETQSPATNTQLSGNSGNEIISPEKPLVRKSARMAYNFPAEMKRNESQDINVYVSLVNSENFVKDTLMKIVALQKDPNTGKSEKDSIVTANILLYKRIKVELLDPDSAFRIKQIYGQAWQDVDSTGDNRWRWNVIPLTNRSEAKLVIKVIAETPAGKPKDIDDRTFFIRIRMTGPGQTVRSWLTYLQDNPGMVLTVILIPLIAYFGKRYFDKKSKQNSEKT